MKSDKRSSKDLNKQNKFDEKVLKFITSSFLPMSVVENPDFVALFEDSNIQVKSRKHMQDLLYKYNKRMELKIKDELEKVSYVCCTADVWSGKLATTTDNGSNFIKAFKTFGVKLSRDDDDKKEDEFEFRGFTNHEANMFIESPFVYNTAAI
ncbi:hypothetical protein FF38_00735 [Lucilia cuprina]|uniref:DUF659 domain-containing protein n=1 Tax=Lucilia cuprina TaxID=7375 RepID=A0A0L0CQA1_LUCCU|nr:hypothetical protein FF38_00735 [Lucilia cuprina]